MPGSSR